MTWNIRKSKRNRIVYVEIIREERDGSLIDYEMVGYFRSGTGHFERIVNDRYIPGDIYRSAQLTAMLDK